MAKFLWTQRQDIGPSARGGHALAFHPGRGRVILFGGAGRDGVLGDTWEWDGDLWTQVDDSGPPARTSGGMTFDGTDIILFGGELAAVGGVPSVAGDTWRWDGSGWTQIDDSGPQARGYAPLAFLPGTDDVLMFGGTTGTAMLRDTWVLSRDGWTQVDDTGPDARAAHALAFDAEVGSAVLFGGAAFGTTFSDTWGWDGDRWTQLQDIGPGGTAHGAFAGADGGVVLFGGSDALFTEAAALSADTWRWKGRTWSQVQDIGPNARWGSAAAVDVTRSRVVLFGGFTKLRGDHGAVGDTWEAPVEITPSDSTLRFIDVGQLTLGSPYGVLAFSLDTPTAAASPIDVWLDGEREQTMNLRLPAGLTQGLVVFPLGGRAPGTLAVRARVAGSSGYVDVELVSGAGLGSLTAPNDHVPAGGPLTVALTVDADAQTRRIWVAAIDPLGPGPSSLFLFPQVTVPPGATQVQQTYTLAAAARPGTHRLIAFGEHDPARRCSGLLTVTVT